MVLAIFAIFQNIFDIFEKQRIRRNIEQSIEIEKFSALESIKIPSESLRTGLVFLSAFTARYNKNILIGQSLSDDIRTRFNQGYYALDQIVIAIDEIKCVLTV